MWTRVCCCRGLKLTNYIMYLKDRTVKRFHRKCTFFVALMAALGGSFFSEILFPKEAQAERKWFQGFSQKLKYGTAVIIIDGEEKARVSLNNSQFEVNVDIEEGANIIQILLLDAEGNPHQRKVLSYKNFQENVISEVGIRSSIAAALSHYEPSKASILEQSANEDFDHLEKCIEAICGVLEELELVSSLSQLELIDRLLAGENVLSIFQDKLGSETTNIVIRELKNSESFPKEKDGNINLSVLNELVFLLK